MTLTDWIGFIGVFQILLAYLLHLFGIIKQDDWSFLLLNLIGAALACLASVMMLYWPFIILEGVWTLATLISIFNKLYGRRKQAG